MYKHLTLEELKKTLKLPKKYHVDAFVIYGSYQEAAYKRKFLSLLKGKKYTVEKLQNDFIRKILSVKVGGKRIWFCVEYGGARLSEFLHFACMLGSKKNILVGTCGGLKKGLKKFTIIVPTHSHSTESSCHMYMRNVNENRFNPSNLLSAELTAILQRKELNVVREPTVTCQAMMGETWEDIVKWEREGFYGVEMEASTVFAVSEHFKVPAAAMLQVADNLIEKEMVLSESYMEKRKTLKNIRKTMFAAAIESIL